MSAAGAPATPPVALTVAGTDPCGGAGIAADLRTFAALGVHGALAVAAVTVQDTTGVSEVHALDAGLVTAQIRAVCGDLDVAATKTGLLSTPDNVAAVAAQAPALGSLVVDPVLRASTGAALGGEGLAEAYLRALVPVATVVTPNTDEAAALTGVPVDDVAAMRRAAARLVAAGAGAAVVTGGHLGGRAVVDVVCDGAGCVELSAPRVPTGNTHGTGCTFAAAVAAHLALGRNAADAARLAQQFVGRALAGATGWRLGTGPGPLDQLGWGAG